MHPLMLAKVIESCRARIAEGDCPTTPAFPVEQLEEAVAELAGIPRDDARDAAHYRELVETDFSVSAINRAIDRERQRAAMQEGQHSKSASER